MAHLQAQKVPNSNLHVHGNLVNGKNLKKNVFIYTIIPFIKNKLRIFDVCIKKR